MKKAIKTCALLLLACSLFLASCSIPVQEDGQGELGSFTVRLGGNLTGRAAYPPQSQTDLDDLELVVKFLIGNTLKDTFTASQSDKVEASIAVGTYTVQVEVWDISSLSGTLYATGSKSQVTIAAGINNPITVDVYEAGVVFISPATYSLNKGSTLQLSATVSGYGDQGVDWDIATAGVASGTDIDPDGLLTVDLGETLTSLTITATSWADPTKTGTATVDLVAAGALTGSVSITGTKAVGGRLTADTSLLGGSGTITYEWFSCSDNILYSSIPGAVNDYYDIIGTDNGMYIHVVVSRFGIPGDITSAPVFVSKNITINVDPTTYSVSPIVNLPFYDERTQLYYIDIPELTTETVQVRIVDNPYGITGSVYITGSGSTYLPLTLVDDTIAMTPNPVTLDLTIVSSPGFTLVGNPAVKVVVFNGATAGNPIPVGQSNIEHFNFYANTSPGLAKHYKLTGNIDISSAGILNWAPIGSSSTVNFTGTFDGGNRKIDNLTVNNPATDCQGLFGYIGAAGIVKNVRISGNVTGKDFSGGVAGVNRGTVQNCSFQGSVTGSVGNNASEIGGVVGTNRTGPGIGMVEKCYSTGSVSSYKQAGGVAGSNQGGTVKNCYSTANVSVTNEQAGGVVGRSEGTSRIENCYSAGNVSGNSFVGGIVAVNATSGSSLVTNCVALNKTITKVGSGSDTNFGRVVGRNYATLTNNKARNDMAFSGISVSVSSNSSGIHGQTVTAGTAYLTVFIGWDAVIWSFPASTLVTGGVLPILLAVPESPAPLLP